MKIQKLFDISLDEAGINFLISLPEPEKTPLAKANSKELSEACKTFRKLWGELVIDQVNLPSIKLKDMPEDMIVPTTSEEIWDSLFLTISYYYNYSFHRLVEKGKEVGLPFGLNLDSIQSFIPQKIDKIDDHYRIRSLSFEYFMCIFDLYFSPILNEGMLPTWVTSRFISSYHSSLHRFFRQCMTLSGRKKNACLNLFYSVLNYATDVFVATPENAEYKPGMFSVIRTEELSLIASRDDGIAKRYGAKNLEKVFEHQLALIMQSFGMYVISTKMGIRTVDLMCISPFPDKQYTFLIEAKTTNKPYSLPRKDFRALKEYVDDIRHTLHTLPPLRFVLICAYRPSKTLNDKLREFQAETGVPIRFISSKQITDLRENIIGPLQSDIFADKILLSPYILEGDFVSDIQKKYATLQKAHSDFVETIFSVKGIVRNIESRNALEE